MPSHTYFRIGRYLDSLSANIAAVEADEAYLASRPRTPAIYPYTYYPHNMHFVLASAQMAGDGRAHALGGRAARGQDPGRGRGLDRLGADDQGGALLRPRPVQRAANAFSALPDPGDGFPFVKAMWHYARGVAAGRARAGSRPPAAEAARIAELERARTSRCCSRLVRAGAGRAAARPARARGADRAGRGRSRAGDPRSSGRGRRSRTSCPTWSRPTGIIPCASRSAPRCCMAGEAGAAAETFQTALIDAPNNGWALFGPDAGAAGAGRRGRAPR